jgi:cell division transport system permease protein
VGRDLRRTGVLGPLAVLLVGLAVVLGGATRLGGEVLARQAAAWRSEVRLVAILRDGSGGRGDDARGLVAGIRALPGVAGVRFLSADDALAELRRALGSAGDGLDLLSGNPLAARLEIVPSSQLDAAGLAALADGLARQGGVAEVRAALDWVAPLERVTRGVTRGGYALAGLLALGGALALTGGTLAAARARGGEAQVLRLVGVGEAALRVPLVLQAVIVAALGAGLGLLLLLGLSEGGGATWVGLPGRAVGAALGLPPLPAPGWSAAAAYLGGGVALGLGAGLLGARP